MYNHHYRIFIVTQNKDSGLKKEAVNGPSKRTKRRKDSSDSQHSDKAKKCCKKLKKSKEKSEETKKTSSVPQTVSDPAPSDSEEDYSLCAAPWCREPEGDEVGLTAAYSIQYAHISSESNYTNTVSSPTNP